MLCLDKVIWEGFLLEVQVILSMQGVFLELHYGRILGINCLVGVAYYFPPCDLYSLRRSMFNNMKNFISNVVTFFSSQSFEKEESLNKGCLSLIKWYIVSDEDFISFQ